MIIVLQIGSSDEMVPGGMKGPTSSPTSGLAPASLASAAAPPDRHRGVLGAARHVDRSPEQMQVHVHVHVHVLYMCVILHTCNYCYIRCVFFAGEEFYQS